MVNRCLSFLRSQLSSHCLLCGRSKSGPSPLTENPAICLDCLYDLPLIQHACPRCAMPTPSAQDDECGQCLKKPPVFHRALTPYLYEAPIRQLVTGFKHRQRMSYGQLLAQLLVYHLTQHYQPGRLPQLIIPVPLHPKKMRKRGFNQSVEIARVVSSHYNIPLATELVSRTKHTESQQGQNAKARHQGVAGAFEMLRPLKHTRIALVDDVITTGATAGEVSKTLLAAGAKDIHVWALARTVRSQ